MDRTLLLPRAQRICQWQSRPDKRAYREAARDFAEPRGALRIVPTRGERLCISQSTISYRLFDHNLKFLLNRRKYFSLGRLGRSQWVFLHWFGKLLVARQLFLPLHFLNLVKGTLVNPLDSKPLKGAKLNFCYL